MSLQPSPDAHNTSGLSEQASRASGLPKTQRRKANAKKRASMLSHTSIGSPIGGTPPQLPARPPEKRQKQLAITADRTPTDPEELLEVCGPSYAANHRKAWLSLGHTEEATTFLFPKTNFRPPPRQDERPLVLSRGDHAITAHLTPLHLKVRRVADCASCLFRACGYLLFGKESNRVADQLRHIALDTIITSWGGYSELYALSIAFEKRFVIHMAHSSATVTVLGAYPPHLSRLAIVPEELTVAYVNGLHYDPIVPMLPEDEAEADKIRL
ncbi:hypothetical protein B484DRAFT_470808 [Ochromonadaceae sp. CCMP2298]|nr:hypothetical protein B484DRAFT_470808 [Ochromonadaceae sp. CCMP2298]